MGSVEHHVELDVCPLRQIARAVQYKRKGATVCNEREQISVVQLRQEGNKATNLRIRRPSEGTDSHCMGSVGGDKFFRCEVEDVYLSCFRRHRHPRAVRTLSDIVKKLSIKVRNPANKG